MESGVPTWPSWRVASATRRALGSAPAVFRVAILAAVAGVAGATLVGCAEDGQQRVVRGADDVQVMTPDEVAAARAAIDNDPSAPGASDAPNGTGSSVPGDGADDEPADDTIPLNSDDRPPELKLFDAFGKFRRCIEDKGYVIEGNLQDPNNPAYQDAGYRDAVGTCAARTDIVNILAEVQATRAELTPDEVEARNEAFVELAECLEDKGWTVETRTSEIGLLEPAVFEGPDGTLNERDINQCVSELNIGEG